MARHKFKYHAIALGVSAALSLAAVAAASAAPWSVGPDEATDPGIAFAPGPTAAPAPYEGYSAYAPAPYAPSYYDYYGGTYYGDDDAFLARRAFPPGCGAGEPHC